MGAHLDTTSCLISCTFLMQKRGIYYFRRTVPVDLKRFFKCSRIMVSLRTRDLRVAKARAMQMSMKLQHEFDHLRWRENTETFSRYVSSIQTPLGASDAPTLQEACDLYAMTKGKHKPKTFHQSLQRAVRYLALACGDKPIDTYSRDDANNYRDSLSGRGLSSASVMKSLNIIRAMLNFVCRKKDIDLVTSFPAIHIDEAGSAERRQPVPVEIIRSVQAECQLIDDEARWVQTLGDVTTIFFYTSLFSSVPNALSLDTAQVSGWIFLVGVAIFLF